VAAGTPARQPLLQSLLESVGGIIRDGERAPNSRLPEAAGSRFFDASRTPLHKARKADRRESKLIELFAWNLEAHFSPQRSITVIGN
jgi:hypothetical protein